MPFFPQRSMYHDSMKVLFTPVWELMKDVRKKALMRLEYEGCPSNYEDPGTYAMEKYAYYVCFKCKKVIESQFSSDKRIVTILD